MMLEVVNLDRLTGEPRSAGYAVSRTDVSNVRPYALIAQGRLLIVRCGEHELLVLEKTRAA